MSKYNLEFCKSYIETHTYPGVCLSTEYVNCDIKMIWECSHGHQTEKPLQTLFKNKQNLWCNVCIRIEKGWRERPITIEECQAYAKDHDGEFLDTVYVGVMHKYRWKCKNGHTFLASLQILRKHSWCTECIKHTGGPMRPEGLRICQELAEKNGGAFLSTEYAGMDYKHLWRCSENHEFESVPRNIEKGHWCFDCARIAQGKGQLNKDGLERCQKAAQENGGRLVSTEYLGVNVNHDWECSQGHGWPATPGNVMGTFSTWCPYCPRKSEQECREILEEIFDEKFIKCKPPFLKNAEHPKGLELDGYCEELDLAFEYDGIFHYKVIEGMNTEAKLRLQQKNDRDKDKLCKEKGVRLLRIPYFIKDRISFIEEELKDLM